LNESLLLRLGFIDSFFLLKCFGDELYSLDDVVEQNSVKAKIIFWEEGTLGNRARL
jgi:hypothetical protein